MMTTRKAASLAESVARGRTRGLTSYVRENIYDGLERIEALATDAANLSRASERHSALSKIRVTLANVCREQGLNKLTVAKVGDGYRVVPGKQPCQLRQLNLLRKKLRAVALECRALPEGQRKQIFEEFKALVVSQSGSHSQ